MAEIAALVGDPARANILSALMDGRTLTAKELAYAARVAPSTASAHLAALTGAALLTCKQQGRHRYYRLACSLVGSMLESILAVATRTSPPARRETWRGGEALRTARSCYDHLAGRLAVAPADRLQARGHIALAPDGGEVRLRYPDGRFRKFRLRSLEIFEKKPLTPWGAYLRSIDCQTGRLATRGERPSASHPLSLRIYLGDLPLVFDVYVELAVTRSDSELRFSPQRNVADRLPRRRVDHAGGSGIAIEGEHAFGGGIVENRVGVIQLIPG